MRIRVYMGVSACLYVSSCACPIYLGPWVYVHINGSVDSELSIRKRVRLRASVRMFEGPLVLDIR